LSSFLGATGRCAAGGLRLLELVDQFDHRITGLEDHGRWRFVRFHTAAWPAACTLVSAADITSVVGTAPKDPPTNSSSSECDYSSPSAYNFVNVSVRPELSSHFFQQDATSAGATEAGSGVGDATFETPVGAQAGSILVLKGKNSLRIDLYEPMTPATQAQLK